MIIWTIGLLIGQLVASFLFNNFSIYLLLATLIATMLLALFSFKTKHFIFIFLFGICLSFSWTSWHSYTYHHNLLAKNLEAKTLITQGYIASLPNVKTRSISFVYQVVKINNIRGLNRKLKVKLSWYNQHKHQALKAGDKWQLYIRLKRPHGFNNPGSFNVKAYAMEQGITAMGYVVTKAQNKMLAHSWYYPEQQLRQYLQSKIIMDSKQGDIASALILALTIGDRSGINQAAWQIFRNTGTSHLMAISGLHIGLCAGFIFFLVNFLWRRSLWLCLKLPSKEAAAIAAVLIAFVYSVLAGFGLPTIRALIMISVFMFCVYTRRKLVPFRAYFLALSIVLLVTPFAVMNAGFWLSFAAVGVIIYGISYRLQLKGLWWKYGRVQWVVTLGLIPFSLLFFQKTAFNAFLANLIAIPWVGFLVVPLSLLGCLLALINNTAASLCFKFAALLLNILWPILNYIANIPYLVVNFSMPNLLLFILSLIGLLIFLLPRAMPRILGMFFILPLLFFKPARPEFASLWLYVMDVGQGLSIVVQTEHHNLIYDAGPKFSPEFNTGDAVLIPFLTQQHIKHIDLLMLSHGDNDHIGGAFSLVKNFKIGRVLVGNRVKSLNHQQNYCLAGEHWQWDGVKFDILYPMHAPTKKTKRNASSCVLRITVGNKHILLPGDIEKNAEHYLVHNKAGQLAANILIAPHHGSKTSSTLEFIIKVHPQYVIFSTGYLNRFKFPSAVILKRYQQQNVQMFNTALDGMISLKLKNEGKAEFSK